MAEDPQNLIDDVQKIFQEMHATNTKAAELAMYQLKVVANTWYETLEESRGEDATAKALVFEILKQNEMSVNEYYLKFVSLAKYAQEMVRDMSARVVLGLSDDLFTDANIAAHNNDMTITKMVAFVQGKKDRLKEEVRLKREKDMEFSKRAKTAGNFSQGGISRI
ncbi:uncharacterized protein [Nicotiana tomentosiformis]|uniref:uncharacterized protein n=1 Tax=Nicotiana tomentosiformis TaxID=4098 RepID=UPI00388C3D94